MNHRKGVPSQQLGVVPPHKPPVAQPKTAVPSLAPPAPPVYWPQPASKAAQPKIVHAAQPRVPTAAPPVYRPQPAPQASQAKTAIGQARRAGAPQPPRAGASMPRPPAALPRPATLPAKPSGIIQAAFSAAGGLARNRVNAITGGANNFDPYGGFTFAAWHPNGARIGFDQAIVADVVANAPHDNLGPPNWYTCPYCNFEHPLARMQVDHIIPGLLIRR